MFQTPNQNPLSKLLNFNARKIFLSKPQKYSKPQNNCSQGCKSQAWQIGPGRSGPQIWVDWTFSNIRLFLNEQYLILNELLIKFKFSLKNLSKIRIGIKLLKLFAGRAGPGRYGPRFQLGPRIYNSDSSTKAQISFKTQIVNWKNFCRIWDPPCNLSFKLSEKFRDSYDDF